MKIRFTGTEACPDEITLRGVTFARGKSVVIEEPDFQAKLLALDYFEQVKRGRKPNGANNA